MNASENKINQEDYLLNDQEVLEAILLELPS